MQARFLHFPYGYAYFNLYVHWLWYALACTKIAGASKAGTLSFLKLSYKVYAFILSFQFMCSDGGMHLLRASPMYTNMEWFTFNLLCFWL